MAKSKRLPPYFVWRDGRPRWVPGPALRAKGFAGQDLKDGGGEWLSYGKAIDAAIALNALTSGATKDAGTTSRLPPSSRNMSALFAEYMTNRGSPFEKLRPRTALDYRRHMAILEAWCGDIPVMLLSRKSIRAFHAHAAEQRGLAMANALLRVLNIALNYARDELEWLAVNRAARMKPAQPQGRLVLWTPEELRAFVETADAMGIESQADAAILAALTGQRRADILTLERGDLDGGHYVLRQRKRNARAFVPLTRPLRARLLAMRERARTRWPNVAQVCELVRAATGAPYAAEGSCFNKEWQRVMDAARESCPSLEGKTFADLRDTAVTWLFMAELTLAEIVNITGHSMKTAQTILNDHYFVRNEELAGSARVKLDVYLERIGFG